MMRGSAARDGQRPRSCGRRTAVLAAVALATLLAWSGVANATVAWFPIHNWYAGLCLDAKNDAGGNPRNNGDKVQLWTCNGSLQQQWYVNAFNGQIKNGYGGLCLDAENDAGGNPSNNGDKVQLWTCNNLGQQYWY